MPRKFFLQTYYSSKKIAQKSFFHSPPLTRLTGPSLNTVDLPEVLYVSFVVPR